MAQPAVTKRIDRAIELAQKARKLCEQYSSAGGWTPAEEQALCDTIDALELLISDSEAALAIAQQDKTNCLNEQ